MEKANTGESKSKYNLNICSFSVFTFVELPESTGPVSSATETHSSQSSSPSSTTATNDKSNVGQKTTNTGAIVGGVIGGLVALCTLLVLALTFLSRRRAGTAPSTMFSMNQRATATNVGRGSYARVYVSGQPTASNPLDLKQRSMETKQDPQDPTSVPHAPLFSSNYIPAVSLRPNKPSWYQ